MQNASNHPDEQDKEQNAKRKEDQVDNERALCVVLTVEVRAVIERPDNNHNEPGNRDCLNQQRYHPILHRHRRRVAR